MSIVYAVLRNELSRLAALRRKYHQERKLLPVGSVCVRKRPREYMHISPIGKMAASFSVTWAEIKTRGSGKCGSLFRSGGRST